MIKPDSEPAASLRKNRTPWALPSYQTTLHRRHHLCSVNLSRFEPLTRPDLTALPCRSLRWMDCI